MGCDIHEYREKKVDGVWVTADEWEDDSEDYDKPPGYSFSNNCPYLNRNYALFGFLANVRVDVPEGFGEPRGLPVDVSKMVRQACTNYGSDGHSHSWVLISELKEKLAELTLAPTNASSYYVSSVQKIISLFDDIGGEDHRFVFWFDNWNTSPTPSDHLSDALSYALAPLKRNKP